MATMSNEINELLRNHVKERLGRGDIVASMTVRLVRGIEIARIAKSAGFDSLYVDLEHSSFSRDHRPDLHRRARSGDHAARPRAGARRGVAGARRRRAWRDRTACAIGR